LFTFLAEDDDLTRNIAQFDFIFIKAGGTKPDVDMVEVAGLERSKLTYISQRIREKRRAVQALRDEFFVHLLGRPPNKSFSSLRITQSFLNILGDTTRPKKKYQSHLLRVLPQIYTESYFHDLVLLPALIEKTEFNIRNDAPNFNLLKFDFFFLTKLQNHEGDRLMDMQSRPSYRVGLLLGKLAKQFGGDDSPIRSFEKNYVGLLSRRIGTLDDVIRLQSEIMQKLVMHKGEKRGKYLVFIPYDIARQLTGEIHAFIGPYDKDSCAFGFFEGYFAPYTKAEQTQAESEPGDESKASSTEPQQ
jgi:hypothetical protein